MLWNGLPTKLSYVRMNFSTCFCGAEESIHFALPIPLTGMWAVGLRIAGAAELAVNMVNADKSLLPGRVLKYSWADSGCSAKQGLTAMGELLARESRIDAVIGPGCSSACEVTSHLSEGQGIPQISWGCTSPTLSNKNEYQLVSFLPLFFLVSRVLGISGSGDLGISGSRVFGFSDSQVLRFSGSRALRFSGSRVLSFSVSRFLVLGFSGSR